MKSKDITPKSMFEFNPDTIIVCNDDRSYANKKVIDLDDDEFAEYVFDNCDLEYKFSVNDTVFKGYDMFYLNHIPKAHPRVYLYGVWSVLKAMIKSK
jgi:hypothetical protein